MLRQRLAPGTSWNAVRQAIRSGRVLVDGQVEIDPARRVTAGAEVAFDPRARKAAPPPEIRVEIAFEDSDLVVIDKPAGVSSVPYEHRETGTAMDLLRDAWRRAGRKHVTRQPLFIVHRIDKETSGLLLYAKNKAAERHLAEQFRNHTVERTYLCVVHGKATSRRIDSQLVSDRGDGLRGTARHKSQGGKLATTHVEVLEILGRGASTRCRVRLETGRTHQIRIHLAEAGHPLVGERVYIRDLLRQGGVPLASPRLCLHAATLGFLHPRTGKRIHLTAELPKDFPEKFGGKFGDTILNSDSTRK